VPLDPEKRVSWILYSSHGLPAIVRDDDHELRAHYARYRVLGIYDDATEAFLALDAAAESALARLTAVTRPSLPDLR
jgi:hypothetical protein